MNYKKFLGAASAALMVVIVVTLVSAPSASAQTKFKTLYKFKGGKDGSAPVARLILDGAGNLYGTTLDGGAYDAGTAFELTPNADGSWTKIVLHSFHHSDGAYPHSGLIFDSAGNLYGMTQNGGQLSLCGHGCGVVFKLTPNADGTWTESVLHSFQFSDGWYPDGDLIFDSAGNLYGTTFYGGPGYGYGTVFKLTPNASGSWTESVLHAFHGSDGNAPVAVCLIFDAAGNLYGTTSGGGHRSGGVVFKLTPNPDGSWTESVLHSFTGGKDGGYPIQGLVFDQTGKLYGTTLQGGNLNYCYGYGCGVFFQLTPKADGSWTEKVLHNFTGGKDGSSGYGGLIFDGAGNLYGTSGGGNLNYCNGYGCGAIIKLAPNSNGGWKKTVLHTFSGKDGAYPTGITLDGTGNLYGMTAEGGNLSLCSSQGCGVVFKLAPNANGGWRETLLHTFSDRPGAYPIGGAIFDAAGNLYGVTTGDENTTYGSVFEIKP